jgi:lipopolysaccharide exporter
MTNAQQGNPNSFEKAAMFMLISRAIVKSLSIISTLILVRLISPEDFGLVSIALAIYGFVEIFGLFGFHNALVQNGNPTEDDYHIVFTFGLLFGVFASIVTAIAAPYAATYYEDPRIQEALLWISLIFIINGFKNIKTVKFQIDMDFKRELFFQVIPKITSFICTISLAYYLRDFRALIFGMLINSLVTNVVSYMMIKYVPKIKLSGSKELWKYSKWLMLNSILQYFNNRAVDLIVGKQVSVRAVGIYSLSNEISSLPMTEIAGPINKASFAAYSKAKADPESLLSIFKKNTALTSTLSLPISAGLLVTAALFVPVAFGAQWNDAILLIQIMSATCLIGAVCANSGYVLMSLGLSKLTFYVSLFRTILFLLALYLFIPITGLYAVGWSSLIATLIASWVSIVVLQKHAGFGFGAIATSVWRPVVSSLIMSIIVYSSNQIINAATQFLQLIILIIVGVVSYGLSLYILWLYSGRPKGVEHDILSKLKLA